ncbi:MAG: hypothetical protein GXO04_06545 [Aquificae bacterium]|nr:hypothetical protein [Aquificota bacterium]
MLIYIFGILLFKIPLFELKRVEVYGVKESEFPVLEEEIARLGRRLLFLPEDILLRRLNELFSNRFESVELRRRFSFEGSVVELFLNRREALARVFMSGKELLIDPEGVIFFDENQKPGYLIVVKSEERFLPAKALVLSLLSYGREVRVLGNKTLVLDRGRRLILPPADSIGEKELLLLERLGRLGGEHREIDMRYKSFILLR